MNLIKKLLSGVVLVGIVSLSLSTVTYAHVTVKPAEVPTASYQTFTVSVPNEKTIATTKIKLDIPEGITGATPTVKPGWEISIEREGDGEAARVTSIIWSGGEIGDGLRDEFTFSAKTPEKDDKIEWKAYQTYSDDTVMAWDRAESEGGHGEASVSGPFSVTSVGTDVDSNDHLHDESLGKNNDASRVSDWALYTSVAALLIGLGSLFVALRKK
ncbi:YcnI family protein [Candidatus Saccharibacteria bacterium]|nr:YcnI family protein [Candidatus Saccharibacteria bacterium]